MSVVTMAREGSMHLRTQPRACHILNQGEEIRSCRHVQSQKAEMLWLLLSRVRMLVVTMGRRPQPPTHSNQNGSVLIVIYREREEEVFHRQSMFMRKCC